MLYGLNDWIYGQEGKNSVAVYQDVLIQPSLKKLGKFWLEYNKLTLKIFFHFLEQL